METEINFKNKNKNNDFLIFILFLSKKVVRNFQGILKKIKTS